MLYCGKRSVLTECMLEGFFLDDILFVLSNYSLSFLRPLSYLKLALYMLKFYRYIFTFRKHLIEIMRVMDVC